MVVLKVLIPLEMSTQQNKGHKKHGKPQQAFILLLQITIA